MLLITLAAIPLVKGEYESGLLWLSNRISINQERHIGELVLIQLESTADLIKQGIAIDTLKTIGDKLTENSAYDYQWLIKKDNSVNAFALPAGIVVVNLGLIEKLDNADELAAVLAHEIEHVEQRHALKGMITNLGWTSLLTLALGDVNSATAIMTQQLGTLYFSREKEEQADKLGVQALITAKINPQAMLTVLEKLKKLDSNSVSFEWLSSHPDTEARIKNIQQLLNDNPCNDCQSLSIDWKTVQQDNSLLK
jgi:predicted Zn-dependent protease